jgi:aspartyl-tRNA synthetase
MVSGFDRYFQIAPCFRDEDARADRSPGEFYQLDLEMSFVTQKDVFAAVEPVMRGVFKEFSGGKPVTQKFRHIPHAEAMLKYGTDKPDLRNPLEITDLTEEFRRDEVEFRAFKNIINAGGVVRAIRVRDAAAQPRSFFDKLNDWARQDMGAPGLGYIVLEEAEPTRTVLTDLLRAWGEVERDRKRAKEAEVLERIQAAAENHSFGKGPINKFIPHRVLVKMAWKAHAQAGDALFFAADKPASAARLAGAARNKIADELGLIDQNRFELCWIVDFPMYEWNEEEKRIDFSHNPFSMPNMAAEDFLALDPADRETILSIKAFQYDLVCNGVELSSGAIRNHRPDVMRKAFAIAGYGENTLEQKFGGMLRALSLGAPPHGGIAPGIDRIVMLLCGEENLREVVLFPMNQRAEDLMMGAPSEVTPKQLRELHVRLALPEKSG